MANQTIYIADAAEHAVRLTAVDWALLDLPRLRPLARVAFAVLRTGQQTTVPRVQLLSTAQQLLFEIELDLEKLSCDYSFEYASPGSTPGSSPAPGSGRTPTPGSTPRRAGTGLSATIAGQPRFLRAGFGLCEAVERAPDPAGRWVDTDTRDLRSSSEIDTDDRGRLLIRARPHRIVLVDSLESLIRFLEGHPTCKTITLRGSNAPPSLLTLIRTYEAGGQSAAWAQEALWDLGVGLRDRLIALLTEPAACEHHPAVARTLMTLVGDDASRAAIRARADAEREPQLKLTYLELLDGTFLRAQAPAEASIDDEIDPSQIELDMDDDDQPLDDEQIDAAMRDRPRTPQTLNQKGQDEPEQRDARNKGNESADDGNSPYESQRSATAQPRVTPTPQPNAKRAKPAGDGDTIPQPNLRPMPDPRIREDKPASE